ncbi:MAG TPA: ABC transporter substrate-binding protein [Bradyrhizobium sp.]|jgi:putative ABC transport system substrate-binding protein|nr:ABC transporter substrate-binding protein [Bradyrhizobium sp.]
MNRRSLLQLAGGAAIAWPLPALAQKGADLPLVAMLVPGNAELARQRVEVVRAGIKEAGLVEGTHYSFAMRFAGGDFSRLPGLAKELDALKPRVFVASGAAVRTIHEELPNAPLVFTSFAADPIAFGLARSYTHPGGNATGNVMNAVGGEESLTEKRFGFFKELVPNLTRLGMIGTATGLLSAAEQNALRKVAPKLGFELAPYLIKTLDDLGEAFSSGLRDGVGALYISGDSVLYNNMARVMQLAATAGKPTVGTYPEWARAGLLMAYSADLMDDFRRAGIYAAKIIQGASPGDLPIEQASKFTLAVNVKTAKQLGISVPPTLLTLADEVIE